MEDKRKDMMRTMKLTISYNSLYGFSDEQLLRDFKEMEADNTPRPEWSLSRTSLTGSGRISRRNGQPDLQRKERRSSPKKPRP